MLVLKHQAPFEEHETIIMQRTEDLVGPNTGTSTSSPVHVKDYGNTKQFQKLYPPNSKVRSDSGLLKSIRESPDSTTELDSKIQNGILKQLNTITSENDGSGHQNGSLGVPSGNYLLTEPDKTDTTLMSSRHGVHFKRRVGEDQEIDREAEPQQQDMVQARNLEFQGREKSSSALFAKLRTLTNPSFHGRTTSEIGPGEGSVTKEQGPRSASVGYDPQGLDYFQLNAGSGENDADAEESANEENISNRSRGRKRKPLYVNTGDLSASTLKSPRKSSFFRDINNSGLSSSPGKGRFLRRVATLNNEDQREGNSEDEGRGRLSSSNLRRTNTMWSHTRRPSFNGISHVSPAGSPSERRPSNFRRLTSFVNAPDSTPSSRRFRNDRTMTTSVQKWRQLKAGLKLLGPKKRDGNRVDHAKSTELVAELLAGAPPVLMLASTFQRDDHNTKRIPVLLDQLKLHLSESHVDESGSGDRHAQFKIELEYGSGLTRMNWVVYRSLRDFTNLHIRYGISIRKHKYVHSKPQGPNKGKLPRFPRSTFPYLRGMRGLFDGEEEEEEENTAGDGSGQDPETSGTDRPGRVRNRPSTLNATRRKSSFAGGLLTGTDSTEAAGLADNRKETFSQRQRKKLENYLYQLIRWCIFRPEGNRLCRFLELSVLGIRLAPEGGYHGKEGRLMIKSTKRLSYRTIIPPAILTDQFTRKWFLVRQSYIVSVDTPEEMGIHDVFLVDSDFSIRAQRRVLLEQNGVEIAKAAKASALHPKHHQLKLRNAERKLNLLSKSEKILHQFEESIKFMASQTEWSKVHRFDSFAPVRRHVHAQWLVDGRDYMWNVSRAIEMASDVIYIHDWWLSPELYLRRPPAISQKWRLDRLLQRKAQQGVKIFVIMYRNINTAIPIDSEYSKFSLLDLHPNIFVQRSPNQMRQNTFFWAHHEKLCAIDHTIVFCGGIDLCFGRWDTAQHAVVDDNDSGFDLSHKSKGANHCQIWPGKDYSNPRVQDFYNLDKPYEDMYERAKIPRMPWHDISMQIVGQPARDLTRHFVQRWNYILRQRKPSRPTPFLLPPPDFVPDELHALGLDGTCEVQVLRSACAWSIGTPNKTEHSIMNAYVKMIETSEHFVYIENQFFISTCEMEGTKIDNLIGDALVRRIIKAHREDTDWRAVVIIPLMPGFQNTVDSPDGSSVRLIMQCQFRSICRGSTSIFGRLRAAGIEPEDYIQFFSLRSWGRIGPQKSLVTEQLYIHAKIMVVDDRVAIIGSANINERSMLGSRDSEVAVIVRDTEMLPSYMGGEPYEVGRFPHTLRLRLMREHLGIDVDQLMEEEREAEFSEESSDDKKPIGSTSSVSEHGQEHEVATNDQKMQDALLLKAEQLHSFNHDATANEDRRILEINKKPTSDPRVTNNKEHKQDVGGEGVDRMLEHIEKAHDQDARDSVILPSGREVIVSDIAPEGKGSLVAPAKSKDRKEEKAKMQKIKNDEEKEKERAKVLPVLPHMKTEAAGLSNLSQLPPLPSMDDSDIGGPPVLKHFVPSTGDVLSATLADVKHPFISMESMKDPLDDESYIDTWYAVAENNTKLFRVVFRCMPDSEVKSWKEYKEYASYSERFNKAQGADRNKPQTHDVSVMSAPPGSGSGKNTHTGNFSEKLDEKSHHVIDYISEKTPINSRSNHPFSKAHDWVEKRAHCDTFNHTNEKVEMQGPKDVKLLPSDTPTKANVGFSDTKIGNVGCTNKSGCDSNGTNEKASLANSEKTASAETTAAIAGIAQKTGGSQRRRRRTTTKSSMRAFNALDYLLQREEADEIIGLVQGNLVLWPYDW